jgi:hypothetical protein
MKGWRDGRMADRGRDWGAHRYRDGGMDGDGRILGWS